MSGLSSALARVAVCGLLVLGVWGSVALAAVNPLDPSFGNGGVVTAPSERHGVILGLAEDRAGRIVAAGQTSGDNFGLLRYLGNGALDTSFGGGLVETELALRSRANEVAIQPDGKIVAAGLETTRGSRFSSFVLARYNEGGRLDPSFGKHGLAITHLGQNGGGAFGLAIQPNGKIVATGLRHTSSHGSAGLLIRYRANGKIDKSFGSGGRVEFPAGEGGEAAITDVAVLPGGKVLAAGGINGRFLLTRLLPGGKLDPSFGSGDGRVTTGIGPPQSCACPISGSLAVRPDGGAVVAGSVSGNSRVARYRPNGVLYRGFGKAGVVSLHLGALGAPGDVALQESGGIDVAGYSSSGFLEVFRYLPNGSRDPRFGDSGTFSQRVGNTSQAYASLIQPDGKLVIGGRSDQPESGREHEFPLENAQFLLMRFLP